MSRLLAVIVARDKHSPEDEQKLRLSLAIIVVLLAKLPPSPNVHSYLWTSIYLVVMLSRSTANLEKTFTQVIAYINHSVERGEPFVDPAFRLMASDFERCGLLPVLERVPPALHLESNLSLWTPTTQGRFVRNPRAPSSQTSYAALPTVYVGPNWYQSMLIFKQ